MFKLAAHQLRAIEEIRQRDVALWYKPRTGKTMCPLAYIAEGIRDGSVNNALVICPASAITAWEQNIEKVPLFDGYDALDRDMLQEIVTITSYGKFKTMQMDKGTHRPPHRKVRPRDQFLKPWDIVIVDESHALGDRTSQQTRAILQIAEYAARRVILTGTPDGKRYEKLYGQLKFLDPDLWPKVADFDAEIIKERDFFKKPIKYHEDRALELRDHYGIYARLEECYDMPPILADDIRYVDLAEKAAYNDMLKGNFTKWNIDPQGGGTSGIKRLQIVSGHIKTDAGTVQLRTAKETALADYILGTDEPLVIFCQFRASIDLCARIAEDCGRSPVTYDGRADLYDWQKFQSGQHDVIVAQYQRGSQCIDLNRADTTIFFEPTGSSINHEQARSRTRAVKTSKIPTSNVYLVTRGTLEQKLFDRMIAGLDTPDSMLDRME